MVSAAGIEVGSKAANLVLNLIQIAARRQTLWGHLGLFLRDTFLPFTSPV